jgi:Tol biopolymer transport system component
VPTKGLFAAILLLGLPLSSVGAQDASPDGASVALPWKGFAQTLNLQTGGLTTVPRGDGATQTLWSPNGRFLLFTSGRGETSLRLFDTTTGSTRVLGANLTFPAGWREDSNRITLFHLPPTGKKELIQYGVAEKGIALRLDATVLPNTSVQMVWLPATDNVAFVGADGNIYTMEEGEFKKITTSGDVIGLALSGDKKSLVWARRGPNPKYILVTFYSYDLSSRSVRRLEFPGNIPGVNPDPSHAPLSIESASLSPNGLLVALTLVEQAPRPKLSPAPASTGKKPGAKPAKPATLPAPGPAPKSKVVYLVKMDGSQAFIAAKAAENASMTPFWSRDGATLFTLVSGAAGSSLSSRSVDGSSSRTLLDSGR